MTAAAALPAAAERMVRSAGGRRVLRVSLFVGALFALGLLFGGRAQAAEAMDAPQRSDTVTTSTATSTEGSGSELRPELESEPESDSEPGAERGAFAGKQAARTVTSPDGTSPTISNPKPAHKLTQKPAYKLTLTPAHKLTQKPAYKLKRNLAPKPALNPTLKPALNPTLNPALKPALNSALNPALRATASTIAASATAKSTGSTSATVTTVVRSLTAEVVRAVGNPLGALAEEAARRLPESPFPRPSLPGLGDIGPGQEATQPVPDRTAPPVREHGPGVGGEQRKERQDSAYQLRERRVGAFAMAGHPAHDSVGRDARRPQPQLPYDGPQGPGPYGIAGQSASDSGAQRHGELHAAAATGEPTFGLMAGEGVGAAYYPTRDRHRDILEFPG
ncbi:hypothetical protein [Streptomyces luteolus]|uniref:Secreted protein n=1 Tax=Streptomyces luteolus TaxID=3043615 RepID=A0ABT6SVX7_9ACTN|nr:hypothetical protein [Streptomyces sp. B-S-A12]MDI3419760.1 hypothetical protein [Streptomyces sp. B-S-A12]